MESRKLRSENVGQWIGEHLGIFAVEEEARRKRRRLAGREEPLAVSNFLGAIACILIDL